MKWPVQRRSLDDTTDINYARRHHLSGLAHGNHFILNA
jgi:hypothetical protein